MGEDPQSTRNDIVFSLENGIVWASWPGIGQRVSLGPQEAVAYMMKDFLAQNEVAERLNAHGPE